MTEPPRYPGYDVLAKRATSSWNEATRRVIDQRLATPRKPSFFTAAQWKTADAVCRRILPVDDTAVPLVALLDAKLQADHGDGFRDAGMPYMREAWQRGLVAIDADARADHAGVDFASLPEHDQDALLERVQRGECTRAHWGDMQPARFFARRVLVDVPALFYCQPAAWNELGFGGPASPRGYVRMEAGRRDPWEAAEATPGREEDAERENRRVV
jgi:hypothetical protein